MAAAGGTLIATPNTNVGDGQYVKLRFSGYPPQVGVVFRQCVVNPANVATDCTAINRPASAAADSSGGGETYMQLYSGRDARLQNAGKTGLIACDNNHPCVVALVRTLNDLSNAAFAAVSFAPSTDDCPDPGANAVFGSGSATAYRAIYSWQTAVCVAPSSLPIVYAVINGVDGVASFAQGQQQANFAVAGPLPPVTPTSTTPSYEVAPITASAVVLAYRMYDLSGPQITNLTLTPAEIAQMYVGLLNNLGRDPGVQSLNPGIQFPGILHVYARAERSEETWAFTSWLAAALGPAWQAGAQTVFPSVTGVSGRSGSRAVGEAVVTPPDNGFNSGEGNIGFMDSSTAAYYGLPTVRIAMPGGATVAATPTTIAQGLSLATQNSDGTYTPAFTPSDPTAYPMSIPTYMLAPTNQIPPDQGKALAAFLRYAVKQGQTSLPGGYVPLPALMVNQSLTVADLIPQKASAASSGGAGTSSAGSPSFAGGDLSSGGLGSSEGLSGLSAQTSGGGGRNAKPGGSKPGAATVAAGPALTALPLAAGARWVLVSVGALAIFGVVVGPLTYLFARPWPPPYLRRLRRLLRLGSADTSVP